jgi:Tol biopolymer transport system component
MWIGKDEYEGIPSSPRKDLSPAPHWRLETVAVTERPRSLTIGADGRTLVFIQDRPDTSDVWTMTLDDPTPRRLTTGREPAPFWEDITPQLSPDGSTVASVPRMMPFDELNDILGTDQWDSLEDNLRGTT